MIHMMLMIMMMQMILQMTGQKNSATVIMMTVTMMPMITGKTRWTIKFGVCLSDDIRNGGEKCFQQRLLLL